MQERLEELQKEALQKIETATNLKELNDVRVAYLGKKDLLLRYYVVWVNYQQKNVQKWGRLSM